MELLPFNCTDQAIIGVAHRWTAHLAAEDYARAFELLLYVPAHPGKSWVSSPEMLRAWVVNSGSDEPIPGEPECRVTPIETAAGSPWPTLPSLSRSASERYPGCRGRLDWQLPLNGEWSDLVASFDLVAQVDALALVLVALRVP
jgi:hypothetical protein